MQTPVEPHLSTDHLAGIRERVATQSSTAWFRDSVTIAPGVVSENVVEHDWDVACFRGGSTSSLQESRERAIRDADFFLHAPNDIRALLEQHDADTRTLAAIANTVAGSTDNLAVQVRAVLGGRVPQLLVAEQNFKDGAEVIHDLLTMLGVDPDEVSNPDIDLDTIAETLAKAVLAVAR